VRAFDIDFYNGSKAELIQKIADASEKSFTYIVTPNVNHVVQLEHNEELRRAYLLASCHTCDSRVLKILLRFMGIHVQEAIPGSTLTEELAAVANARRWRVTVIGSDAQDMQKMQSLYPDVTFFHHNPPMGFIDRPNEVQECVDFVAAHPAHLVVLSVGCPRQEILGRMIFEDGRSRGVGLCVGASINFISGRIKRAPVWMQRMSLEWLHRMCMEPRRLVKRYVIDAYHLATILYRHSRKKYQ
jgi:exopolysaccharide biosynthesis WecB/TagA/CpsF family protein